MAAHEECVLLVAVGTWGGKAGQRLETERPVRKDVGRPEMGDGSEMGKELMQKEGLTQSALSVEKEQLTPTYFQNSDTCGRSLEGGERLCFRGAEFEVLDYGISRTDGGFVLQRKARAGLGVLAIQISQEVGEEIVFRKTIWRQKLRMEPYEKRRKGLGRI